MNEVVEGLYVGSLGAASDDDLLKKDGITHLVSVIESPVPDPNGRKHMVIAVDDWPSDAEKLARAFEPSYRWIAEALANKGRVLVHCFAGVSRSATVAAAFLMQSNKVPSVNDALDLIRKARHCIMPNSAFLIQLRKLERTLINRSLQRNYVEALHPIRTTAGANLVEVVLGYLGLDERSAATPMGLRYGDSFPCAKLILPPTLALTISAPCVKSIKYRPSHWEAATVEIRQAAGDWCLLRIPCLCDDWLLVCETGTTDAFHYTLHTVPHLAGCVWIADEDDGQTILSDRAPYIITDQPQLLSNPSEPNMQ
jgi:protein-tyrosine phosphatase